MMLVKVDCCCYLFRNLCGIGIFNLEYRLIEFMIYDVLKW